MIKGTTYLILGWTTAILPKFTNEVITPEDVIPIILFSMAMANTLEFWINKK